MKKKKIIIICLFLLIGIISGCKKNVNNKEEKEIDVKIIYPSGSPALTLVDLLNKENPLGENVNFKSEMVSGPDSLVAAFTSKSHDIIIAPINLGAKLYNSNPNFGYKYASSVCFGNVYIVASTTESFTVSDLSNYNLFLFGNGTVNDFIARYALKSKDITPSKIEYLKSTEETKNAFLLNENANNAYLIAEPALSAVISQKENVKIIDLQEIYNLNSEYSYIQAGVYIKEELINTNAEIVDDFLSKLETSIKKYDTDLENMANEAVRLGVFSNANILKNAINRVNLGFELNKEGINYLFNEMISMGLGNLIGNRVVDDGFYYQK